MDNYTLIILVTMVIGAVYCLALYTIIFKKITSYFREEQRRKKSELRCKKRGE